jgi:type II secretion system protein G
MKKGFTIIEIIMVIAVIIILASLMLPAANLAREHALKKKAESMIYSIGMACRSYEADTGEFPDNGSLATQLSTAGPNAPYINFKNKEVNGANIIDPWDTNFGYRNPGTKNVGFVDMWCCGPDKATPGAPNEGTGADDIKNW